MLEEAWFQFEGNELPDRTYTQRLANGSWAPTTNLYWGATYQSRKFIDGFWKYYGEAGWP